MGVFVQAHIIKYKCLHGIIMLPGTDPGPVLCMIRERHVILNAALHFRLAV